MGISFIINTLSPNALQRPPSRRWSSAVAVASATPWQLSALPSAPARRIARTPSLLGAWRSSRPVGWRDGALSAQRHPPKPACRDRRRRVRIRFPSWFVYGTDNTTDYEGARNKRTQAVAHRTSANYHGPLTFDCSDGHDDARSRFDQLCLKTCHAYFEAVPSTSSKGRNHEHYPLYHHQRQL